MKIIPFTGTVLAGGLTLSLLGAGAAVAGSEHLQCHAGFQKVATYPNSIKCKRVNIGFPNELSAGRTALDWARDASCNAHMSQPKRKVWKVRGKWKARVTFICANIT
jgi:hypothetical protein